MSNPLVDITYEKIENLLKDDVRVKVAGIDIDGVLRGKVIDKKKFLSIVRDGFGFCSVIFGWDIHDQVYETPTEFSREDRGFFDIIAKPDLASYRRIPWEDNIPFFMVSFLDPDTREPLYTCARGLLKKVSDELEQIGLEPFAGAEFEFFCFNETPASLAQKNHIHPNPLTPGNFGYSLLRPTLNQKFYYDMIDELKEFGIPLEGCHTETGPGVYEASLAYTNANEMGDRAALFKTAVKQIGLRHGIMPSFMAKPHNELPGCSGHLHLSLRWNVNNQNAFARPSNEYSLATTNPAWEDETREMSHVMQWFVAGVIRGLPDIMAILAPTVNSYKRFVKNYWAPVTVSWGWDNRLACIRVITPPTCPGEGTRLELRVPGADINPPLALAAILSLGLHGIRERLTLQMGPINKTSVSGEALPKSLQEATCRMAKPESLARRCLGERFVDHFVMTREHEWKQWEAVVTEWEVRRYLELI